MFAGRCALLHRVLTAWCLQSDVTCPIWDCRPTRHPTRGPTDPQGDVTCCPAVSGSGVIWGSGMLAHGQCTNAPATVATVVSRSCAGFSRVLSGTMTRSCVSANGAATSTLSYFGTMSHVVLSS